MCTPCTQLPAEVWTLVFRHLSLSDRLRVRASCKYFRDLVDNGSVWRDWTVRLSDGLEYEEQFWHTLRRWRVTSACLTSPDNWAHIAKELPGLTSLLISSRYFTDIKVQDLKSFTSLERLHLDLHTIVPLKELFLFLPQQLTHLRVCHEIYVTKPPSVDIFLDSPFKKLKSLVLHCLFESHPVNVLHVVLSSLPELQHLSLMFDTDTSYEDDIPDLPPLTNCSLSSLELVECETNKLPIDFMKMLGTLPSLRSLAIFCPEDEYDECDSDELLRLSMWLRHLPALTSLLVKSSGLSLFIGSIPSSVTRLTLLSPFIDPEDLTALSTQLPNLHHLHLQPEDALGSDTALIPQLFPRLKTLRLSHKQVPEDAFLSLASLQELEVLETLDDEPLPAALVSKLRDLTTNRVRIYKKPEKLWQRACDCSSLIPTDYWT